MSATGEQSAIDLARTVERTKRGSHAASQTEKRARANSQQRDPVTGRFVRREAGTESDAFLPAIACAVVVGVMIGVALARWCGI